MKNGCIQTVTSANRVLFLGNEERARRSAPGAYGIAGAPDAARDADRGMFALLVFAVGLVIGVFVF